MYVHENIGGENACQLWRQVDGECTHMDVYVRIALIDLAYCSAANLQYLIDCRSSGQTFKQIAHK